MMNSLRPAATIGCVIAVAAVSACSGATVPIDRGALPQGAATTQAATAKGCVAPPCIYVANYSNGSRRGSGSITVYSYGANGDSAPVERIAGNKTGLQNPAGVGLDSNRDIYASNVAGYYGGSVTEYAPGSNGNVTPLRTLYNGPSGKHFMLGAANVVVDSAGYIFVPAEQSDSVSVYAPGSSGDSAPARYIHGGKTNLDEPSYLALATNGTIYVPNYRGDSVTIFDRRADGNVAPIRTIAGSQTKLHSCTGLALESNGDIYVSNRSTNSVVIFDKHANGNVAPIATISGPSTGINTPEAIGIDANDQLYVSNAPSQTRGSVTVYAKGASGNVAPIATITGSKTMLDVPNGVVVQ
jgi:6-phosphogluconolactonase (cycloisomerase 2 family)